MRGAIPTKTFGLHMHAKLNDWNNGWFGLELGIAPAELDRLIDLLQMLKREPDQHFHLSSDYRGGGGLGDIEIYVQSPEEPSNMSTLGKALAPGSSSEEERT